MKQTIKQKKVIRNYVAKHNVSRGGVHQKSNKAKRRTDKVRLCREIA